MKKTTKLLLLVLSLAMVFAALALVTSADGSVAMVGNQEYTSFAEAINEAEDGATVKLIANATIDAEEAIAISKNLTVDLGGYALTAPVGFTVNGGKTFTITGDGVINTTNQFIKATDNANVTIKGSMSGITINAGGNPNLILNQGDLLTINNVAIVASATSSVKIIELGYDGDLYLVNSSIKSSSTSANSSAIYINGTSMATVKYTTILTNHASLTNSDGASGKMLKDGDDAPTLFYAENSVFSTINNDSTKDSFVFGTYSRPNGKLTFKDCEIFSSWRMFVFNIDQTYTYNGQEITAQTNKTYIECYNTNLVAVNIRSGGNITRSTDVYLYEGSSIYTSAYIGMVTNSPYHIYFAPGTKVNWEGDTKRATSLIFDPNDKTKTYPATLNATEGEYTFVKNHGPKAVGSSSNISDYIVVKVGEALPPVSDLSYSFTDIYSKNANGVVVTTASGSKVNTNVNNFGLATSSGWIWDWNFTGEVVTGSLANGNNKANNCFKYYSLTESNLASTGVPANFSFGLGKTDPIDVFDKNSDGTYKHNVIVHESQFATDTGKLMPTNIATGTRNTSSGDGGDNVGTLQIQVRENGEISVVNGTVVNRDVKAYTDGRWNTVQFVIYKNGTNEDGTVGAATKNGIGYVYVNGVLVATSEKVYDCDNGGTSHFYGPRYDLVKRDSGLTPGANGNVLLVDNVTVKAFCNEILTEDGKADRGNYVSDSKYFTNNVKIGNTSFSDVNEALKEAELFDTYVTLSGASFSSEPIVTDGYVYANGYTLTPAEGSNPSNTVLDENNAPVYYDFREEYKTVTLPVIWYTDYENEVYVIDEISVGEVPTPPTIKDKLNFSNGTVTNQYAWTASNWITENQTFNNLEIVPLSLSRLVFLKDSYQAVEMVPVVKVETITAALTDNTTGELVVYSTSTNMDANNSPFKQLSDNQTLTLFRDITLNSGKELKNGTFNVDLNGHTLRRNAKATIFALNADATLNVYSSVAGGYMYCAGYGSDSKKIGGVMFQINTASLAESKTEDGKTVTLYKEVNAALEADGAEGGANLYGGAILNIGTYGDIPGSNLTLQGDCIVEPRQGNANCAINIDGVTLIRSGNDYASAILSRFYFGEINISNSVFLGVASSSMIGNHSNGNGAKAVAKIDNCVIITPAQSSLDADTASLVGLDSRAYESITFTNCITNGRMNPCKGGVVYADNCAAYDFDTAVPENTNLIKAHYNVPMSFDAVEANGYVRVIYPTLDGTTVGYDRYAYVLPYGTTVMPEGFREGVDTAIILPLLHTKAISKDEAIKVTWQGAGDNAAVVQNYVPGGNVLAAPAMDDYVATAIILSVTGWKEQFPTNITEAATMTPVVTAKANVKASVNLSLYSDFAINLYVPKEYAPYITNLEGYSEVTVGDVTYLMTTVNKAVTEATDAVTFTFNIVEGKYTATATATVSIAGYAEAVLKGEAYTAADKQLMYYTVAYAAEAAEYFEKSEDTTLTALLTTYASVKGEDLAEKKYANAIEQEEIDEKLGNVFTSATVSLDSAPKFVLTLNDGFAGTVTVSYGDNNTKTYIVTETDSRTIVVGDMKAYNFGATLTITAEGTASANGTYNLDTYAKYIAENGKDDDKEIVDAFYNYVTVASAYKAAIEAPAV